MRLLKYFKISNTQIETLCACLIQTLRADEACGHEEVQMTSDQLSFVSRPASGRYLCFALLLDVEERLTTSTLVLAFTGSNSF